MQHSKHPRGRPPRKKHASNIQNFRKKTIHSRNSPEFECPVEVIRRFLIDLGSLWMHIVRGLQGRRRSGLCGNRSHTPGHVPARALWCHRAPPRARRWSARGQGGRAPEFPRNRLRGPRPGHPGVTRRSFPLGKGWAARNDVCRCNANLRFTQIHF